MSQDERVTGPTLYSAVEELYSCPRSEFTARRKVLSTGARSAGDRELAAQIAALRKPTLSADTMNRLVHAAPEAMAELLDLGTALRSAEKALDAAALRELSSTRRSLVKDLAQLAFDITEQAAPSGSTRDEVVATLNAALADEEVAERLMSGALVTQASWDGFGSSSLPQLAAVIPMLRTRLKTSPRALPDPTAPVPTAPAPSQRRQGKSEQGPPDLAATERAAADRQTSERDRQTSERVATDREATERRKVEMERLLRIEVARAEVEKAEQAASTAAQEVLDIDRRIGELALQIAYQRELLTVAQREARSTEIRRRAARLALTRSGGPPSKK